MKILADENIPALDALFADIGEIRRLPGRKLSAADVADSDILLVRSITRVDEPLLTDSRVGFVGTATIGTDHLDTQWLDRRGVRWCSAPGCNADAVVEYVLSALWHLCAQHGVDPLTRTVGVVGAGNVGGRLVSRLRALGLEVLVSDPPRAEREGHEGFVELEELLSRSDLVALHTPLVDDGPYPTRHLLNEGNLELLKPGAVLLNAGRGPVIDNWALIQFMRRRSDVHLVLDVWEEEPLVLPELAEQCVIATPHIAGYSLDGKIRGTWMLYREVCQWLGREVSITLESVLPKPEIEMLGCSGSVDPLKPIALTYDPYRDDRALRETLYLDPEERMLAFDRLRKHYPVRREFSSLQIMGLENKQQAELLLKLGFNVVMA
ncbi:MAG: 4-phosphoerythronate dehydrogenase PdxB [Oceanospirillales bacterium]|nr:4-phosphoerythronate dehydrogenase PdxB [Oceanospirillales bacterium]